jgi:hypothetical protein
VHDLAGRYGRLRVGKRAFIVIGTREAHRSQHIDALANTRGMLTGPGRRAA